MVREMRWKWIILLVITAIGFFLDWLTKYYAETHLNYGEPVQAIGNYLQFMLVYNKGALFGFNPRAFIPNFPVNQFFFVFTLIAITFLLFYYRSIPKKEIVTHWGLALILPGALGNLFDRVIHAEKGVIDFIRIGVSSEIYWPIFNLADVYVTVGVGLLLYSFIMEEKRKKAQNITGGTIEARNEDDKNPLPVSKQDTASID